MTSNHADPDDVCRICGNSRNNKRFQIKEMMYNTREVFDYFECGNCCCLQICTIPENMALYYPANYYSLKNHGRKNAIKGFLKKQVARHRMESPNLIGALFSRYVSDYHRYGILKKYGFSFHSRFLDVGCGSGKSLFEMARDGFTRLTGVDPYIEDDIHKEDVQIYKQNLVEFAESGTRYDIIQFNHSFEHMPEQTPMLAAAKTLLAPEGIIIVAVPTVSSLAWEKYQCDWVQLDAPRHFYLHSRKSMEIMAASVGLKILEVVYDSNAFQFWGSEQYKNNISLTSPNSYSISPKNSLFSRSDINRFQRLSVELNQQERGDRAFWILSIKS